MMVYAAIFSALYAVLISWFAWPVGNRLGLLDYPDPYGGRKRHAIVTPLVGGLAAVPVFLVAMAVVAYGMEGSQAVTQHAVSSMALLATCLFLLGILDDRFELTPQIRLLVTVGAIGIAATTTRDLSLDFIFFSWQQQPVFISSVAVLVTMVSIVGFINAVNMADGKNGIVIGLCIMWTGCLIWHATPELLMPLVCLLIALCIALAFNLKGRLFLGDGGSYGLACIIAVVAINLYNRNFDTLRADHVLVWFAVPVLDCLRLLVTRSLQGRSPFAGDREHLHHYLHRTLGWPQGLIYYWALAGIPSLVTLLLPQAGLFALVLAVVSYTMTIVVFQRMGSEAGRVTA